MQQNLYRLCNVLFYICLCLRDIGVLEDFPTNGPECRNKNAREGGRF